MERLYKDLEFSVTQARIDAMNEGYSKVLAQNELNYRRESEQISRQQEDLLQKTKERYKTIWESQNPDWEKKGMKFDFDKFISNSMQGIGDKMQKEFGNGNVDLLARPLIDAAELVRKGWEDAGEGIATVFSSQFGIEDASGKEVEILVTPILPDGSVMSPEELEDYIDNILNGADDILKADKKGIVLTLGVDTSGDAGDKLHQYQEQYYELKNLFADADSAINELQTGALKEYEAANKKVLDELAVEYGNYLEKRTALTIKWEKIIAGTPEQFRSGAKQKRDKEIAEIDKEYGKSAKAIENLFSSASGHSVSEMRKIIDEAEVMYNALDKGTYNKSFGITEEQFNVLRRSPEEMKRIAEGIKQMKDEADKSENAFKRVSEGLKKIFSAGNDKAKLKSGFDALKSGLSEINDLAQSVGSNIASVFEAFGNKDAADMATNITNLLGGIGTAGMGAAKLASGDIVGGIKDAVSGLTQTVTSIAKIGDSSKEKAIQALQREYDALDYQISLIDRKISKLQKEASKEFGSNKSDLIYKENEELEKEIQARNTQIEIIQRQANDEKSKKYTDYDKVVALNKQIDGIRQEIADIQDNIKDNEIAAVDALFGSDIQSAITDFAQAYADAWAGGTDRAKDMKKVVRDLIRSYVMEMIKGDEGLQKAIENIRTKIQEYLQDGVIDATEQSMLDGIIEEATSNLDKQYGGMMDIFKDDETRQASQKGFASMSQDSADKLDGKFTAFTALTYSINENTKILVSNSGQILKHLAGIESNTKYCENLEDINKNISSMKSGIDDINLKGITIKK